MSASARKILDDLRRARALVIHPSDEEGAALVEQLRRLGCTVTLAWPPPAAQLDDAQVMHLLPSIEEAEPAVIAIVAYESPTSLKAIADVNAHGVLNKPLHPRGVLTQFALARYRRGYEGRLTSKINRLEETMKGRRTVEKAVRLLVELNRIDEAAYKMLRDRATAARVPMASVAEGVVSAHEAMSGLGLRIALAEKT